LVGTLGIINKSPAFLLIIGKNEKLSVKRVKTSVFDKNHFLFVAPPAVFNHILVYIINYQGLCYTDIIVDPYQKNSHSFAYD